MREHYMYLPAVDMVAACSGFVCYVHWVAFERRATGGFRSSGLAFLPQHVDAVRAKYPGIQVIVHPECRWEVCQKADATGSTERLIKLVADAPEGSMFAIGTEIHLVNRLARQFAPRGKKVITLDDTGCLCTTMYRISPQHLCWALENLVEGRVVNRISVREDVKHWARVALDRMLEIRD